MMKKLAVTTAVIAGFLAAVPVSAQYKAQDAEVQTILEAADSAETPVVITLEQALKIGLSENVSVKVADMEIQRTGFAKKGTYASLFPQIDASGSFQRTIKKQVMYMDFDMGALGGAMGGGAAGDGSAEGGEGTTLPDGVEIPDGSAGAGEGGSSSSNGGGFEVGRWNNFSAGVSASMPLVNAQLWKSLKISGLDVELAVEKARSSRLDNTHQYHKQRDDHKRQLMHTATEVLSNNLRQTLTIISKRYNTRHIVVHSSKENATYGYPQKGNRAITCTKYSTEYRSCACDV